jgi:hypothetical protein
MPDGYSEQRDSGEIGANAGMSCAEEAEILRCGYKIGYFDKSHIERWAERQIAACDEPSATLIDLAMIRQTHPVDVLQLLRSLSQSVDPHVSVEMQIGFIGLLFTSGRLSLHDAVRGLSALVLENDFDFKNKWDIYRLDDEYDLAVHGIWDTVASVESSLRDLLMPRIEELKQRVPAALLGDAG